MSTIALVLVITSAFMHAGWNFFSKRRDPSLAFFFLSATAAAVIMLPVLVWQWGVLEELPTAVWWLILFTGLAQAIYFSGLAGAYRHGDISLAYPLARALPVLFIAVLSVMLSQGAAIGPLGWTGMVLITLGCIVLPLPAFRAIRLSRYLDWVMVMALVAAVGTTAYTLVDDRTLRLMRSMPGEPLSTLEATLLFISLQIISTAIMLCLATLIYPRERRHLGTLLKQRRLVVSAVITGTVIMATYGLVLASMAYASNVSYVAAFRQLSIPIGAVLGLTLQREPRFRPKLIGIGAVTVGLLLVAVG